MHPFPKTKCANERGSALVTSLVVVAVLATVVTSAIVLQIEQGKEAALVGSRTRAEYAAETGVNETLIDLSTALQSSSPLPAGRGSKAVPVETRRAHYWTTLTDNLDGTFTILSRGRSGRSHQDIEAVVQEATGLYHHAIFAGNSEGDPNYELPLGGTGTQADNITGSIFSGGDVTISGDASVTGDIGAGGVITGAAGTEGLMRTLPNIAIQDYENTADVLVADEFGSATFAPSDHGGSAWELPASNLAHIFRRNPDDRTDETGDTAKDDYFLEDPHSATSTYTSAGGGAGFPVTIGGSGSTGNQLTYFIDGNLWIHSSPAKGFRLESSDPNGVQVTIVVRGNIYFSDDLELANPVTDGLALIAIKDEAEPDSGNIYLGDPRYGTLDTVEAFLYAENNFYDNNLSSSGSAEVNLRGNMTAGNQVTIERDYDDADGNTQHSQLNVLFDNRIADGTLDLPSLPSPVNGFEDLEIVFWSLGPPEVN